ncbi:MULTISPECIES: insulinase family protein [unclassified Carboxylicivirga]|uniref:M16 family metallopeptidase n=1 Tax=Carboxylicivirga TaxID=1628153 RepID=UPI003D32632F
MKSLKTAVLLLLLFLCKTGNAQELQMPHEVKMGHLKNGMTYFIIPDGNPGKVKLTMLTKVGALLEKPNQHGYAHMVEHMLFKGSENYPGRACLDELELMGMRRGIDSNGYTGSSSTQYFVTIPENDKDYFERSLRLLKDWMFHLQMDEDILENEKKVIIEEINRAGGDPVGAPNLIGTSLEGHDPLGTKESVKSASINGLYQFYKDNYIPSNMALIVHGKMDQKWAEKQIKRLFSKETAAAGHEPNRYININNTTVVSGQYPKKNDHAPDILVVQFKDEPIEVIDYKSFKAFLKTKLMSRMLDMRINQLMGNSVKKVSVNMGSVIPGNSVYNIRLQLLNNVSYKAVFDSFCKMLAQVQQYGFTPEEIEYVNTIETQFLERRRKIKPDMINKVQNFFISGNMPIETEQYENFTLKALKEITADDYLALFNHMLDLEKTILYNGTSTACSPDFNETAILGKLKLLDTISTPEFVFEGKLAVQRKPKEVRSFQLETRNIAVIRKEKQLDEGLKVLTYPSGVKVVLYDSNDEKATVKMISAKGLSYLPVEERNSYEKSIRYMISAYGKYDDKEARVIERSRGITKKTSIDDYFYELNVNSKSVDLEESLKCFNLLIAEPNYPEAKEVMKALERRNKRKKVNDDANNNVEAALSEALVKRLYEYDRNIKNQIGEAIILVEGNLPDNIEAIVSQYIGSLPSTKTSELNNIDADGIIPDSIIYNPIAWKQDLSKIAYNFRKPSEKTLTLQDELLLQGVKEYAHLKMFSVIREKYGLVYATGRNAEVYKVPFNYSMLRLAFMTDTSNIERAYDIMTNEVLAPLDKAVLSDIELQKIKALVRSLYVMSFYEDQRIRDKWLKAYLKYGKVYSAKELDSIIKALSPRKLEKYLHEIIDLERFELKIHLPEEMI